MVVGSEGDAGDVHRIAESTQGQEGGRAEDCKTNAGGGDESAERQGALAGSRCDGGDTAGTVDEGVYLPMGADAQEDGGCVPSTSECEIEGEEDEGTQNGLGGATGGDAEDEGIEEVGSGQKGCQRVTVEGIVGWQDQRDEKTVDEDAVEEVAGGEQVFPEGRVDEDVGDEEDSEQGSVAIGFSGVGTAKAGVGRRWSGERTRRTLRRADRRASSSSTVPLPWSTGLAESERRR